MLPAKSLVTATVHLLTLQCGLMKSSSQPKATKEAMTSGFSDHKTHHTTTASEQSPSNLTPEASVTSFEEVSPAAADDDDDGELVSEASDFAPLDTPEHVSQEVSPAHSSDLDEWYSPSSSVTAQSSGSRPAA